MRKLASIRKISKIEQIENADAIEKAYIDGWQVVIEKNKYKPGQLIVYIEIDSFVPNSLAPFLTRGKDTPKTYKGLIGERLRTAKFRGCLSQGLVLPIPPALINNVQLGDDVSEKLGIIKFEEEEFNEADGCTYKTIPADITSSEQERIQNINIKNYENKLYEVTEKIDGAACIFYLDENNNICVCTKNYNIGDGGKTPHGTILKELNIEEKFKTLEKDTQRFAIYGEIFGHKMSVNDYKMKNIDFMVYNIFDRISHVFLPANKRMEICKKMGLKHVPVIFDKFSLCQKNHEELLLLAEGFSEINPQILREGLVFKSLDGQDSFKVISNKYLLKYQ